MRAQIILDEDPALAWPEHALLEDALAGLYGPDALQPIPA
jgi:hypothetical protein